MVQTGAIFDLNDSNGYYIATLPGIIGAVIGLIFYFGAVATATEYCGTNADCVNGLIGLAAIFIFPSVGLGVIAGVLVLVASIFSFKAKGAILKGGAGSGASV